MFAKTFTIFLLVSLLQGSYIGVYCQKNELIEDLENCKTLYELASSDEQLNYFQQWQAREKNRYQLAKNNISTELIKANKNESWYAEVESKLLTRLEIPKKCEELAYSINVPILNCKNDSSNEIIGLMTHYNRTVKMRDQLIEIDNMIINYSIDANTDGSRGLIREIAEADAKLSSLYEKIKVANEKYCPFARLDPKAELSVLKKLMIICRYLYESDKISNETNKIKYSKEFDTCKQNVIKYITYTIRIMESSVNAYVLKAELDRIRKKSLP